MEKDYFKKIVDESMKIGDHNLLKSLYVMHYRDVKSDGMVRPAEKFIEVKERIIDDYINLINYYLEKNRTNGNDAKSLVYKSIVKSQLDSIVAAYVEEHKNQLSFEN
jgi:hypothetical protein